MCVCVCEACESLQVIAENYLKKNKELCIIFIDFFNANDTVDQNGLCMILGQYRNHYHLMEAIKRLCERIKCCGESRGKIK